jgi:type IV pilus assembly protein PilQ
MRRSIVLVAALALAAPAAQAAPPKASKRVTIDVQDAELGNVFRLIADVSGENLVYGEDVKGKITLKLKNVPWEQVLEVVCQTKGLGYERKGNIVRIVPQAILDAEAHARLDRAEQQRLKGPLTTRIIPVNYGRARELLEHIKPLLTPRGTATVDERTNTIIVRDVRGSGALRF